jgi:uncharacterized damage-inducible protein DinB
MASEKEQFLAAWDMEFATTRKIVAAIPEAKRDFRPHERSMTARELAWHLVGLEKFFVEGALARNFVLERGPEAPGTLREILGIFDTSHADLVKKLRAADDRALSGTAKFYVAPKQMGDVPIMQILWWGVLLHGVHHRGQLSVHLRMMGEKVPSIYGPSADEPWF